ncbi:uncharacterized protein LOC144179515 isoform X2 [Haemaphysalis longicornis]
MLPVWLSFMLLSLANIGTSYEEKDFNCESTDFLIPTISVCDGVLDCVNASDNVNGVDHSDESEEICAPAPYLDHHLLLFINGATNTTFDIAWNSAKEKIANYSLELAGYFLTGKSQAHSFQKTVSRHRYWYKLHGLHPWTNYTVILRAFYTESGKPESSYKIGRADSVAVITLPSDSYEISVYGVRSNSAVLSWRSSLPVDLFEVTVAKVSPDGVTHTTHRYQYEGTNKASWRPTIAITDLEPWSYYVAILEGCFNGACNESVNTTFITTPSDTPIPTVTRVAATSEHSFEIAWTFPQSDRRLYEGFRVQYCTDSYEDGTCFVADTKEKNFTASRLAMCSQYYVGVSVQYRNQHGVLVSGPPARASIVTWCEVPLLTVTHHDDIDDGFSTSLFAWTCVNSSVRTFEYRLDGRGDWTRCGGSADCDVVVDRASTAARSSGYLRLTHHRENQNFAVGIRGCNWLYGCGKENTVQLNVHSPAPLTTPKVNFTRKDGGVLMMCDQLPQDHHRGLELLWKCNVDDHRHKKRLQRQNFYGSQDTCQTYIHDIDTWHRCKFSIAQYEQRGEQTYYGPRVEVHLD